MTWLYRMLLAAASLSLVWAMACSAPMSAPPGAVLNDLEDVSIAWDPAWYGDGEHDDYWALLRVDFYVYDEEQEVPYNNVVIEIFSGYKETYILPTGVINVTNCPQGEGQWDSYCSDPDQTWGQMTGDFNESLKPTYYRGYTDSRGVETVWIWVEDLPVDEEESVGAVTITATIGVDTKMFEISAGTG